MSNKREQHGGVRHVVGKVQDVMGGLAGRASAGMTTAADSFVENAGIGDLYVIRSAELALKRTSSPDVKTWAKQMIEDHTTSAHQLAAAHEMNETRGVAPIPSELDARRRTMLSHLENAPADKFDSAYLDQQLLAHEETHTLLKTYGKEGDNPQLRSFAEGTLPVVARHLSHVKAFKQRAS